MKHYLLIFMVLLCCVVGQGQIQVKEVIKVTTDLTGTANCVAGKIYYNATSLVNWERNNSGLCATITSGGTPGSVTTVSVVTANGVSGSVANPTTTPAITLTLGAITPSSVTSSGNIVGANVAPGFATTATAAGTTTLTVASKGVQAFTGVTTQTVVLPVVSTLPQTGFSFVIQNDSSDILTVNSSGGNLVQTMAAGTRATFTCKLLTGTTAASWNVAYLPTTFGISNSAGANVVPKSDGVNLITSQITDSGSEVAIASAGYFSQDYIQLLGNDARLNLGVDSPGQTLLGNSGESAVVINHDALTASILAATESIALDGVAHTIINTAVTSQSFVTPNIKVTITSDLTATPTISTPGGIVRIAAAASTVTVTCAICAASTLVFATVRTVDTTLKSVVAVPGSGSFVLTGNAVATGNTDIQVWIVNPN